MYLSENEMPAILRESVQNDDQLLVHVVGDRTIEAVLNAMDATGGKDVWAKRRVRFEHADSLMPDLIPRAKALGVIVVQNPDAPRPERQAVGASTSSPQSADARASRRGYSVGDRV